MVDINSNEVKEALDNFSSWSYSRINSFHICKHMFKCTYIDKLKSEPGVFAQYGLFLHGMMENYSKGELAEWDLVDYYRENYSKNITLDFPPNAWVDLSSSYYNSGEEYLLNFDGYNDELIGAEEKFEFVVKDEERNRDIKLVGVVDRISRDSNGIIISDYKSKKKFKSKKELKEYFRQMYVYSIPVFEKYGEYPYKLKFHLFRDFNNVPETLFDETAFEDAKTYIKDTVDEIYNTTDFEENYNDFFCKYICGVPCDACIYKS